MYRVSQIKYKNCSQIVEVIKLLNGKQVNISVFGNPVDSKFCFNVYTHLNVLCML